MEFYVWLGSWLLDFNQQSYLFVPFFSTYLANWLDKCLCSSSEDIFVKPWSKLKTKPRVDFVFLRHKNNNNNKKNKKNKNNPHQKIITFSLLRRLNFGIKSKYSLSRGFMRKKVFRKNLQEKSSGKIFRNFRVKVFNPRSIYKGQ